MSTVVPVVQAPTKTHQIGHYVFGKTLGEGTFGKVKVATHILTGEKVAIKILEKSKIFDVSDVERVSREIQILKMIRHPHLVQLYEIIETPKQLFLVMEFAIGGELFDYIVQNQRIKDLEAARFFNQIISGIEYIHKLNVVHRDMKPENLLLDTKNRIKIVDFGLSNLYKKDELLKTACGSPCYAAPEMIAGKKYNGLQVDIWSCGVILFAMLCGYLPFEDPNTSALYKKIIAGDYKIPKFVSSEGKDLIKNILNTDPASRYTIADIRRHSWFNLFRQSRVPQGIIMGLNKIPVDTMILSSMSTYGFNLEYAQKCIESNRHNHLTTTYYLLLKKHLHTGGKSMGDIGSDKFEPELIELQLKSKSNSTNPKESKMESTGGTSSKDKQDKDNSLIVRSQIQNQVETRANTQERKPYIDVMTKTVPAREQIMSIQNTSLNNSLIKNKFDEPSLVFKQSSGKVKHIEAETITNYQSNLNATSYPRSNIITPSINEKQQQYRQRRFQNSLHTQINSILNSPRELATKLNNSSENTKRAATNAQVNPFMNNLNTLLNKPLDQQMKRNNINFDTSISKQVETVHNNKNNTIYRQNLHMAQHTQNNFLQQQFRKVKAPTFVSQQRPRGTTQHEVESRIQRRLILGRDSRGKSTEPYEDADNSGFIRHHINLEIKMISGPDSSKLQGRTFYKSSRASPTIETPSNRQYVVPYQLKLSKDNVTQINWRRKD